jgi:hypothetical protein
MVSIGYYLSVARQVSITSLAALIAHADSSEEARGSRRRAIALEDEDTVQVCLHKEPLAFLCCLLWALMSPPSCAGVPIVWFVL